MIIIYAVVSTVGAFGACIGAFMSGEPLTSVRLYGLVIFDSALLLLLSFVMKIDIGKIGDFVALPIMVVCFSSKINCYINGCCTGFVIGETQAGEIIKFPSALFEMALWALLTVILIVLEKVGNSKNLLWPIMVIWFGVFRFVASCFRESEIIEAIPSISGGKIWSIVTLIVGLIYLYYLLHRNLDRRPKLSEFFKAITGD